MRHQVEINLINVSTKISALDRSRGSRSGGAIFQLSAAPAPERTCRSRPRSGHGFPIPNWTRKAGRRCNRPLRKSGHSPPPAAAFRQFLRLGLFGPWRCRLRHLPPIRGCSRKFAHPVPGDSGKSLGGRSARLHNFCEGLTMPSKACRQTRQSLLKHPRNPALSQTIR